MRNREYGFVFSAIFDSQWQGNWPGRRDYGAGDMQNLVDLYGFIIVAVVIIAFAH